jgi:hypothetical protein
MTARDPDRLIRIYLSEGETNLPDRSFDAVRRDIHRTRQRVVIGPWREPDMTSLAKVAIAAAAVVAIAFAWINFGPSQGGNGVGAPQTPTPTATTAPPPSASPRALPNSGLIEPGRYWLNPVGIRDQTTAPRIALTVPAGWTAREGSFVDKNYDTTDAGAGPALVAWQMSGTFVDPCTNHVLVEPTPGPGIDALVDALAHQPGTRAGPPTAVTVDGYSGKFVEVTVTADITKCGGTDGFWIWASPDGDHRYVQGTNEMERIYVLDVEGRRFTFNARIPARTTAADRAELETIIASFDIVP